MSHELVFKLFWVGRLRRYLAFSSIIAAAYALASGRPGFLRL